MLQNLPLQGPRQALLHIFQECESSSTHHSPVVNPLAFQTHSLEVTLRPPSFSGAMGPHCAMCTDVRAHSCTAILCSPAHPSRSSWRAGTPSCSPEHSRGPPSGQHWSALCEGLLIDRQAQRDNATPITSVHQCPWDFSSPNAGAICSHFPSLLERNI